MKRLFLFSFLLLGALKFSIFDFQFSIGEAKACTNLIVGKKASKDGSVIVSYSCDDYGAYGYMNFLPGGKHKKGEMRALYHYESNNYLGEIPEAEETYTVVGLMNEHQLTIYRRKHLGYVFQMYNLIPNLNVKENIEVGAYLSDKPLDVEEVIKTLGLQDHKYKYPNQLSGGQQQRVSIGRAVVKNPDILMCDEPTGALDYKTSKEILALIE